MKKFFWILEWKVWDFISDYGMEKLSHKGGVSLQWSVPGFMIQFTRMMVH